MIKRKFLFPILIMVCFTLTACGSIPKLSADETEMVSEYAASLLLKYDSANHSRLVDTSPFLDSYYAAVKNYEDGKKAYYDAVAYEEELRRREAESQERANAAYNNDGTGGATVINGGESGHKTNVSNIPIAEFLGLGDFSIDYAGAELLDSYPKDTDELYFSLSATNGNKLLVLYFDTTNTSGSASTLDLFHMNAKYRISINGGKNIKVLETMLGDTLSEYLGEFTSGEKKQLSLIVEVPDDTSVQSLTMTITTDGGTLTKALQ